MKGEEERRMDEEVERQKRGRTGERWMYVGKEVVRKLYGE